MAQVPEPAPWVASGDETERVREPPAFPRSGIVDVGVRLPAGRAGPFTVCADGKWGDGRGQVEVAVSRAPTRVGRGA